MGWGEDDIESPSQSAGSKSLVEKSARCTDFTALLLSALSVAKHTTVASHLAQWNSSAKVQSLCVAARQPNSLSRSSFLPRKATQIPFYMLAWNLRLNKSLSLQGYAVTTTLMTIASTELFTTPWRHSSERAQPWLSYGLSSSLLWSLLLSGTRHERDVYPTGDCNQVKGGLSGVPRQWCRVGLIPWRVSDDLVSIPYVSPTSPNQA
jgi:hypothetical protein